MDSTLDGRPANTLSRCRAIWAPEGRSSLRNSPETYSRVSAGDVRIGWNLFFPQMQGNQNRQKVDCGGKRSTFRMRQHRLPLQKAQMFSRANPTYSASTIATMNWYTGIARVSRWILSVSSTSAWNPSLSSMVAMGSSPPYAVKFLPVKSKGVEAPILMGPELTAPSPCMARLFSLSSRLLFTFWVAPENEFAKRQLRFSTCSNAGFSGSPNGCL
jgi:hypothetical protein